jgi:hypothetical protein
MRMFKELLKKPVRLVRSILGIDQIVRFEQRLIDFQWQQMEIQKKIRKELGEIGQLLKKVDSLLTHSVIDADRIKKSAAHIRGAELVALLSPMDVKDAEYTRIGRDFDGGYVMLNNFQESCVAAAYSFGIGNDVSWDEAIADRGIDVFMYDHTIEKLPKGSPLFHFFRQGVTGYRNGVLLKTLGEIVTQNGHAKSNNLIMKMDIEGCEWDVFDETNSDVISQFSQIVIELHGLSVTAGDFEYSQILKVLKKIDKTHQSIHVHGNTCGYPLWIGDIVLPDVLEVTFIRRKDVEGRLVANSRRFPTALDRPTIEGLPDLNLGTFSTDRPNRP